jgi:hypothetical protein
VTIRARWLLVIAGVIGLACSEGTPPSVPQPPGVIVVSLQNPGTEDGAMLVRIRGVGVLAIESAAPEYHVYWRGFSHLDTRVIVIGPLDAGPLFRVRLEGKEPLSAYSASALQVSNRAGVLRPNLAPYGLSVEAAPR